MIDHFMYGVPDLEDGLRWAESTFGVAPMRGGAHPSLGTCNALLSLGTTYLEIIAPDPQQSLAGTFGSRLATLGTGGLITWAARCDLNSIRQTLRAHGIESAGPVSTSRRTPAGQLLEWELLFPRLHSFGGLLPFFIDWLKCDHPSTTSPMAGQLSTFVVSLPDAVKHVGFFQQLAPGVSVQPGEPGLRVDITVDGRHPSLTSNTETLAIRSFA